jgi:arsenate reductase
MKKVLFLCTGNSCRSQMAEAIVNARLGEKWEAVSAGTKPAGYTHPKAIAALAEIGIQHEGRSKLADEFKGMDDMDDFRMVRDEISKIIPQILEQHVN